MSPPDAPRLSVVVPTYEERENLPALVERIDAACRAAGIAYEAIVVDDASPDGTADVARALSPRLPVRVLCREGERGLATAVALGLREARGEVVAAMDADLSHPPERLPDLARPILDGEADMTVGSRHVEGAGIDPGWPLYRRLASRVGALLGRPLAANVNDVTSGFFAVRRALLDGVALSPLGYKIMLEVLVRARPARVREVPIEFLDRARGATKFGLHDQGLYLLHIARLYAVRFPRAARLVAVLAAIGLLSFLGRYTARCIDKAAGDPAVLTGEKVVPPDYADDPDAERGGDGWNDFAVFYRAGRRIADEPGRPLYGVPLAGERHYLYPPIFAIYMSGVARLPPVPAAAYWLVASLLLALLAAWLCAGIVVRDRAPRLAIAALAMLCAGRFLDSDLQNGNANAHVVGLIAIGIALLARGRHALGGSVLAAAAAFKVTPAIFLPYLIYKRAWRATAGFAAGLGLLLVVVPSLVLGPDRALALLADFGRDMLEPFASVDRLPDKYSTSGYSLKAFLLRHLAEVSGSKLGDPEVYVNVASLSPDTVWKIVLVATAALGLACAWAWRRPLAPAALDGAAAHAFLVEVGTVLAAMVIVSPLTRKAHLLVLLVPAAAAAAALFRTLPAGAARARRALSISFAVALVVPLLTSRDVLGRDLERVARAHTLILLAPLSLWLGGIWYLVVANRRPGLAASAPPAAAGPVRGAAGTAATPLDLAAGPVPREAIP